MKFGDFEISSFVEREFELDGGGLFGVIPKVIWQDMVVANDRNMIPVVNNLFVVRAHGKSILFDTGFGDTLTEKEKKVYSVKTESTLESGLEKLGLKPADIDMVFLTHLHTDHAGGAVKRQGDKFVPRFPKATYYASKEEWDHATRPNERTAAVYDPNRLYGLKESGQLTLLDRDWEILPGIDLVHVGGHTEGQLAVMMHSHGEQVWYLSDIVPTRYHLRTAYVAAADLHPAETMEVKRHLIPRAIREGAVLAFDHDPEVPLGAIAQYGRDLVATPPEQEVEQEDTAG